VIVVAFNQKVSTIKKKKKPKKNIGTIAIPILSTNSFFFLVSATDFVKKLLVVDPKKRMSAKEALEHPFITRVLTPTSRPKFNLRSSMEAVLTKHKAMKDNQEVAMMEH
jgi:serine/threonine protein kinase